MSNELRAFPKIFNLGNSYIPNLFKGVVEITEKVDGSQFGFGITPDGEVVCRSKGVQLHSREQNKMFAEGWDAVESIAHFLKDAWRDNEKIDAYGAYFYGEYLRTPKHNTLKYDRTPKNNIIIFGACIGGEFVDDHETLTKLAEDMGFETVPMIYKGYYSTDIDGLNHFKKMLETESILGGQSIEGVVIKNYKQPCMIGNLVMPSFGKYVRPDFRELNDINWKDNSTGNKMEDFFKTFKSEARWDKAIQHLRDAGSLQSAPQDIGPLMKEIAADIESECKEDIKEFLYKQHIGDIKRIALGGFPLWYKEKLLTGAFKEDGS